jgi:hypothetical protein
MSKYVIDKTTLTAIGDAVRAKGNTEDKILVSDLATAITNLPTGGGEEYFTDEELTFTGRCDYLFSHDKWKSILEKEKNRIKIKNPSVLTGLLEGCRGEDYSFLTIEGDGKTIVPATGIFSDNPNLKKIPKVSNLILNGNQSNTIFGYNHNFTDTNQLIEFFDNVTFSNSTAQGFPIGGSMYSLRNIDAVMPYFKKSYANYKSGANYSYLCSSYYALDEINNIPIINGARTYNGFTYTFSSAARLKNITFETDNGTAIPVQWKSQTIDLSGNDGVGTLNKHTSTSYILNYSSGITADKEVKDDATYQALKNDPDWWAKDNAYSRYNHDSAVNTINSLPDTSAYLATAGGTNTIKFNGVAGLKTDGGAINTLTEEEIAVATAKGWTVSLV